MFRIQGHQASNSNQTPDNSQNPKKRQLTSLTTPNPPLFLSLDLSPPPHFPRQCESGPKTYNRIVVLQMASACVNNIGMSTEKFPPATYPSYGWLSPRISFSREFPDDDASKLAGAKSSSSPANGQPEGSDPEISAAEFEFRLEDPVAMLPADELFSGGKLMPLQFSSVKPPVNDSSSTEIGSPDAAKYRRRPEISCTDPYLFSPKAPRCSSRWRELLGLKKLYQNSATATAKSESHKTTSSSSTNAPKSLKHFLHRSSKSLSSSSDASLSLPLLKDFDCESVSISSSRLSLSSSSSGHEHEDLPRLSLDSDKPNNSTPPNPIISIHRANPKQARVRTVKTRETTTKQRPAAAAADQSRMGRSPMRMPAGETTGVASRGVSVDSPRMNSSGKIVFQSLERSSSSPSSFNGGPRLKHRGMERSYSANVRVTPVLNVPVCSLRGSSKAGSVFGFGQLFSAPQKKDGNGAVSGHHSRGQHSHYTHHNLGKSNRT